MESSSAFYTSFLYNSGMDVLEEHLSVAASVYNPYCFCVMRHIITIALFKMIFKSKIYCSDIFCSFLFDISGLVYQNAWYGKTQVTSCELRVESLKARVEIQKCEFKSTSSKII